MGTKAHLVTAFTFLVSAFAAPTSAFASGNPARPAVAPRHAPTAVIKGGHDQKSSWLVANYRELQLRTRTNRATLWTTIEVRVEADVVTISVAPRSVLVSRGGREIAIDSPQALIDVQELLGGSMAIFAVRAMLSDLEPASALTAPDMALLSTAAYVASVVGDVGAPLRIADRFMEKHRGIYRQARENGQCWSDYSKEASAAWDELQACMDEADQRGFVMAALERLACNGVWLLRAESAWFEYLKCVSPLSSIPQ